MGKMPLYTMLQKARSMGGWTMVAQLEGDAAGSQLLLLEGRPVWQRGDSTVLLQHLTELQGCTAAGIHSVAGTDIFAERFGAVPQLVVCGGGHVAAAVVQLAKLLGLTVLAMDDREEYAQQLRPEPIKCSACRLIKRLRRYLTAQRLILWSSPGHMHLMWTA